VISKILLGFDGSECSQRALEFSLDLAEKYSASVTVLNVLELPFYGSPEDPFVASPNMAEFVKDMRKSHENILSNAAEKAAALKPALNVTTELREGNPSAQIVATATEGGFDMIVVGMVEKTGFESYF
jgi:nucleotide-binding universal stress UspA family protein